MSKKFDDLLTAYMVARDRVNTENKKYELFEEKPTLDIAIQERREARSKLLAYVAELESKSQGE
jgi:DNA-binding transcriptional regulator YbjK